MGKEHNTIRRVCAIAVHSAILDAQLLKAHRAQRVCFAVYRTAPRRSIAVSAPIDVASLPEVTAATVVTAGSRDGDLAWNNVSFRCRFPYGHVMFRGEDTADEVLHAASEGTSAFSSSGSGRGELLVELQRVSLKDGRRRTIAVKSFTFAQLLQRPVTPDVAQCLVETEAAAPEASGSSPKVKDKSKKRDFFAGVGAGLLLSDVGSPAAANVLPVVCRVSLAIATSLDLTREVRPAVAYFVAVEIDSDGERCTPRLPIPRPSLRERIERKKVELLRRFGHGSSPTNETGSDSDRGRSHALSGRGGDSAVEADAASWEPGNDGLLRSHSESFAAQSVVSIEVLEQQQQSRHRRDRQPAAEPHATTHLGSGGKAASLPVLHRDPDVALGDRKELSQTGGAVLGLGPALVTTAERFVATASSLPLRQLAFVVLWGVSSPLSSERLPVVSLAEFGGSVVIVADEDGPTTESQVASVLSTCADLLAAKHAEQPNTSRVRWQVCVVGTDALLCATFRTLVSARKSFPLLVFPLLRHPGDENSSSGDAALDPRWELCSFLQRSSLAWPRRVVTNRENAAQEALLAIATYTRLQTAEVSFPMGVIMLTRRDGTTVSTAFAKSVVVESSSGVAATYWLASSADATLGTTSSGTSSVVSRGVASAQTFPREPTYSSGERIRKKPKLLAVLRVPTGLLPFSTADQHHRSLSSPLRSSGPLSAVASSSGFTPTQPSSRAVSSSFDTTTVPPPPRLPLRLWTTRDLERGLSLQPMTRAPAILQTSVYGRDVARVWCSVDGSSGPSATPREGSGGEVLFVRVDGKPAVECAAVTVADGATNSWRVPVAVVRR